MRPIRKATLARPTPHGVLLDCGAAGTCRISLYPDGIGRALFLRPGGPCQPKSWMVLPPGEQDTPWEGRDRTDEAAWPVPTIARDLAGLVLQTDQIGVRITLDPFRLEWLLPDGRAFLADRASAPYLQAHRSGALAHYVARDPADRYYGLGDKTGPLDLHGRRLRTAMRDALGYDPQRGDPLYKHWPFVLARDGVTGTAYGLFYDNAAEATFDLGCEHDNYFGLFRGYEATDGDLDIYVLAGPRLADVTPRFLRLTGGTALPPRWSLGYAQTTMALADAPDAQARIEGFIARCGTEQVPISAFHFGSGYTSIGPKRYVFHWNRDKFPDPDGLVRQFHAAGIRVVANLKPCLLDDHPHYAAAQASGAFITDGESGQPLLSQFWDGEGAYVDFTSPAGIAWWQAGLNRAVLGTGIDAGWNDNNEYELWDEAATCANFGHPAALAQMRPLQALLMTRATAEAQRSATPAERMFTVTRAGCPGVQRYAQSWSGDNTTSWDSLRWNLRTGLQMSLSGLYNVGHDIGGFAGPLPDAEMLVRWTQSGVVHPRFIMNSWKPDGAYNSPWLHPEALPAIRDAIRLRYRLMPYLYSLMHAAATDHDPVLRPTLLAYEDDPACAADCDELMLGPFLLAAPVVHPGERVRRVYLPAGPEAWFDVHTGERLPAGTTVEIPAPLDRLPLLAPAGAILPMTADPQPASDASPLPHDEPSRVVHLFPGPGQGTSHFVLVEDDGLSTDGPQTRLRFDLAWSPDAVSLHLAVTGGYVLPTAVIGVTLPPGDTRPLRLVCDSARVALRR